MKAWIVGILVISLSGILIYGLRVTLNPPYHQAVETVSVVEPPTVEELLTLVNAERANVGVAPLVLDQRLNASAQLKADDMQTDGYYNHIDPVTGKNGATYIFDTAPGICKIASENLVSEVSTHSARNAVSSWMASVKHKEAILDPKYTITGFGISKDYAVEHFCSLH